MTVPQGIDATTPSTARIYDYVLGGKDNYRADQEAAEKLIAAVPEARQIARANRVFLQRAVRFCAEAGITQFIDIGTGVPTYPAVHDVAQQVTPQARIVYIDNDPVALAHARALMANMGGNEDRVAVVEADMRRPADIIDHPVLGRFIDWDQPVAVLLLLMLHFVTDEEDPEGIVSAFRNRMVAGSFMAVSHVSGDEPPRDDVQRLEAVYSNATSSISLRSHERISRMLDGLTLVDPGLVFTKSWRPDLPPEIPAEQQPGRSWVYAALGAKPSR